MPLTIKQFASDTNSTTSPILYTVPAGRLAKIVLSNLLTTTDGVGSCSLVVGNLQIPAGTTYNTSGGAGYQPPLPMQYYIGAGQTVMVLRTGGTATICKVQFVAIEEAAA